DAVGHQLDERVGSRVVGEADLVADELAHGAAELLRDASGDGARRDASRLRVTDEAGLAASCVETDLRELRGLARAGLAADDDHLMPANRVGDLVGTRGDRELVGIAYRGPARRTLAPPRDRAVDRVGNALPLGRRAVRATDPLEASRQRGRVRAHRFAE